MTELQMITSVMTDDIDYLVYMLLKDGNYFSELDKKEYSDNNNNNIENTCSLDDWFFNNEEEVKG